MSYTSTDVSIKKIGQKYSASFNGTTSLIDTGSDFIETKAITVCGWIKLTGWGGGGYPRIFDNGKTLLWINSTSKVIVLSATTSGAVVKSDDNSIFLNKSQFVAVTRTSAGVANFYIGDLDTAPALSGDANQTDGTPTAGTTNVIIGNNVAQTRTFDGLIPMLQVYEGILDLATITRIYTETKNLIGN
jgi:hypothetical protein